MKKINIPLNGLTAQIKDGTLITFSANGLKTLSTTVLGGGFSNTRYILNHQVDSDFNHSAPARYLKNVSLRLGIRENVVAMMTAADIKDHSIKSDAKGRVRVAAIVTGGISNAAIAGREPLHSAQNAGTINTIVLIDGRLTRAAMAGAIITSSEAKTVALRDLGVKFKGDIATGTSTDAIVIACTGRGLKLSYSGTGTELGRLIGKTVLKGTASAIKKQEGWL